jgi:hypothetical protein
MKRERSDCLRHEGAARTGFLCRTAKNGVKSRIMDGIAHAATERAVWGMDQTRTIACGEMIFSGLLNELGVPTTASAGPFAPRLWQEQKNSTAQ